MLVFKSILSPAKMDTDGACAAQATTMFNRVQTLTRSKLATVKSGTRGDSSGRSGSSSGVGGASGSLDDGRALHGRLSTLSEREIELAEREKGVYGRGDVRALRLELIS